MMAGERGRASCLNNHPIMSCRLARATWAMRPFEGQVAAAGMLFPLPLCRVLPSRLLVLQAPFTDALPQMFTAVSSNLPAHQLLSSKQTAASGKGRKM